MRQSNYKKFPGEISSPVPGIPIWTLKAGCAWTDLKEAVLLGGREPINSSGVVTD